MNTQFTRNTLRIGFTLIALITLSTAVFAEPLGALVDDFSQPHHNRLGYQRLYFSDSLAGGATTSEQRIAQDVLYFSGDIVPPRGQPGWASAVLPLNAEGASVDASRFEGIHLVIKILRGNGSISANSSDITNFDYHASHLAVKADGQFHELHIPFKHMKRAWSAQTPLNTQTLTSLSLSAYGLQKGRFDFEVKHLGFYEK